MKKIQLSLIKFSSNFLLIPFIEIIILIARIKRVLFNRSFKSVAFIGNNYNSFYTLATALNKRGWDAISVNPDINCSYVQKSHIDIDLSSHWNALWLFKKLCFSYKFLHVYNRTDNAIYSGSMILFNRAISVKNLRRAGVLVVFSPSGCLNGSTSKEINALTNGLCNKCIWQGNNLVCNESNNLKMIDWIKQNCVIYSNEVDQPKKLALSPIGVNLPLSPFDSKIYTLNLTIPNAHRIQNNDNEIIVLTAFANEKLRSDEQSDKDIKGKKHMVSAIHRLIAEGYPLKHFHASDIPAKDMKYYQAQADIILDQLNYGSIGAATREGMMLGKPVVCHISNLIRSTNIAMKDCPAVNATEETIYDVLKELVEMSDENRQAIGARSREWMLKWFDADVCAARYEKLASAAVSKRPFTPPEQFI